jgi:hypothetical protein
VAKLAVFFVEAEEETRDPRALLAPRDADDDAVGGLVTLDLDDRLARAGHVGQLKALRDHAVEPRDIETLEPVLRDVRIAGRGRDVIRKPLDVLSPLLEGPVVHRLAVPKKHVEADERRRHLSRQLANAALGGMEAHLQRVEVERAAPLDHDLAVDGG